MVSSMNAFFFLIIFYPGYIIKGLCNHLYFYDNGKEALIMLFVETFSTMFVCIFIKKDIPHLFYLQCYL